MYTIPSPSSRGSIRSVIFIRSLLFTLSSYYKNFKLSSEMLYKYLNYVCDSYLQSNVYFTKTRRVQSTNRISLILSKFYSHSKKSKVNTLESATNKYIVYESTLRSALSQIRWRFTLYLNSSKLFGSMVFLVMLLFGNISRIYSESTPRTFHLSPPQ